MPPIASLSNTWRKAVDAALRRDLSVLSELQGFPPSTVRKIEVYLRNLATAMEGPFLEALSDPLTRFVGLNSDNRLTIFHCPQLVRTSEDSLYFAGHGDDFTTEAFATLPTDSFEKVTIGLTSDAAADSLSPSTKLRRIPTECHSLAPANAPPANNNGAAAGGNNAAAEIPTISNAQLRFPNEAPYGQGPTFVAIPCLFPLPPGEHFELEGHCVSDPIPSATEEKMYPQFRTWVSIIRDTIAINGAPCNSSAGTLFRHQEVISETAEDSTEEVPSPIITALGNRVTDTFSTTFEPRLPMDSVVKLNKSQYYASGISWFEKLLAEAPTGVAAASAPQPSTVPGLSDDTLVRLFSASHTARTNDHERDYSVSKASSDASKRSGARYQALFGYEDPTSEFFCPAELTASFKEILNASKTEQKRLFRELFRELSHRLHDDKQDWWHSLISVDDSLAISAFVTQVVQGNYVRNLVSARDGRLSEELSLINFLTPDKDSQAWATMTDIEYLATSELNHEPDVKKHHKRGKHLYTGGFLRHYKDLQACVANFIVLAFLIVEQPLKSKLVATLLKCIKDVDKTDSIQHIQALHQMHPHLLYQMVLCLQKVLQSFLTTFAFDTAVTSSILANRPIPLSDEMRHAFAPVGLLLNFNSIVLDGSCTDVSIPPSFSWFSSGRGYIPPEASETSETSKRNGEGKQNGKKAKKAKKDDPPDASAKPAKKDLTDEEIELKKSKGIVVWKGPKNACPRFPHVFPEAKTEKKTPCSGHIFIGKFCRNVHCKHYHPPGWRKLSEDARQAFCAFVNSNENLAFADNAGPDNVTPNPIPDAYEQRTRFANALHRRIPPAVIEPDPEPESPPIQDLYPIPRRESTVVDPSGPVKKNSVPEGGAVILSDQPPKFYTTKDLEQFADTLEPEVKAMLDNTNGKNEPVNAPVTANATTNPSILRDYDPRRNFFVSETGTNSAGESIFEFRFLIPHIINSGFLDSSSTNVLWKASYLARLYYELIADYRESDPTGARGYEPYANAATETSLNTDRIRATTAALLSQGCNLEKLVRYVRGPHVAANRNVPRILSKLAHSCTAHERAELDRVFRKGAPRYIRATNTRENLLKYYSYGNHATVNTHPDIFRKAVVKDYRRGNTLAFDKRLFFFIPHTHLTPQGLADVDNKWKKPRTIFDSSFRPDESAMAINDWTNKAHEPTVTYPGSFQRLLIDIWNLRITYPDSPIYLGDDDVTNAFRLIKTSPSVVGMHCYQFEEHTFVATGQTFGDSFSPANFEPAAICRQRHSQWLWKHRSSEVLDRAAPYLKNMVLDSGSSDTRVFAQANRDSLNPGKRAPDGSREPPRYPMQVDDCLYADVEPHLRQTVSASIVGLLDVFDGHHPYLDSPLSLEKLNTTYSEQRTLLGHHIDTRSMVVQLSPRRKESVLRQIDDGWLRPDFKCTLRDIACLNGALWSACEFFPWGRAQLLTLQALLRELIQSKYQAYNAQIRIKHQKRYEEVARRMPKDMEYRLEFLKASWQVKAMWNCKIALSIPDNVRQCIQLIRDYICSNEPWEMPIGHIVPRPPDFISYSDASTFAIGVTIPAIKAWCILPYGPAIFAAAQTKEIHINYFEFVGLFLAYSMVLTMHQEDPSQFNPTPVLLAMGDNTSANSWWSKMSSKSPKGRNLLRLYAELHRLSPVHSFAQHVKGVDNTVADDVSRPHELFSPPLITLSGLYFSTLVKQWTKAKALYRDLFPIVSDRFETEHLNFIIALYAIHLSGGHTLLQRRIKADTIRMYLAAAASFIKCCDPQLGRDARYPLHSTTSFTPQLSKILQQIKITDAAPKKQEPYTLAMQKALFDRVKPSLQSGRDSLDKALFQWFGVALQGGNRRCEWAQPDTHRTHGTYQLNDYKTCYAFTLGDIEFLGARKNPIPTERALQSRQSVEFVRVTYRWQKNGDHGQTKIYTRNRKNAACDSVEHFLCICDRFVRLRGAHVRNEPLSIYRADDGNIYNITHSDICSLMRDLAKQVYGITSKQGLAMWTPHSLRIGACCILWAMGKPAEFIQWALRWRSESWKDYIRDLTIHAHQHNDAIAECWDMPVF